MPKVFDGVVLSVRPKIAIVDVKRSVVHKLYKKVRRFNKKFKVDPGEFTLSPGDKVKIVETRPISKSKYFKIQEVVKDDTA